LRRRSTAPILSTVKTYKLNQVRYSAANTAVLHDSGCRIGQAVGLRHEDIAPAERDISIVRRANDNGARSKCRQPRGRSRSTGSCCGSAPTTCMVSTATWAATTCSSTGIDFDPHWWRHTVATRMLRDGVPIEVVSKLLGHAQVTTRLDQQTQDNDRAYIRHRAAPNQGHQGPSSRAAGLARALKRIGSAQTRWRGSTRLIS
jgi:integrase